MKIRVTIRTDKLKSHVTDEIEFSDEELFEQGDNVAAYIEQTAKDVAFSHIDWWYETIEE